MAEAETLASDVWGQRCLELGALLRSQAKAGGSLTRALGALEPVSRAPHDSQLRPVLFRGHGRRLRLARQILEGVGVEQSLVELAPLIRGCLAQRRVPDDLFDAAAQLGARHWRRAGRAEILGGRMSQENVEIARRFVEGFNAGEFAWEQLDPGVVLVIDPPAFLAGTYHGHDGVRTLLARFTEIFDEARYEIDELLDGGDSVVALGRFRVRGAQSGATGTQPIAVVVKVRDRKLVAYRAYFDREQALEAVGLRE